MTLPTTAEARTRNTLGKAVHPAAIRRLHELFPNARVVVEHMAYPRLLPRGERKMGRRYYANPARETRVYIDLDGDRAAFRRGRGGWVWGLAVCHPEDNFDRRKGINIAFRRALDSARGKARHN